MRHVRRSQRKFVAFPKRRNDVTSDPYYTLLIAVIRQAQQDAFCAQASLQEEAKLFLQWCKETAG